MNDRGCAETSCEGFPHWSPGDRQPARVGFYSNADSLINAIVTYNDFRGFRGIAESGFGYSSLTLDLFQRFEFAPVKFKRGIAMGQKVRNAVAARVEMEFVRYLQGI